MIAVTVGEVARLLGGTVTGAAEAAVGTTLTGVAVDSRQVESGTLFVALPGERVDGHDFVATALASGAAAALTARPVPDVGPCLVVPDPLVALGRLARDQTDRGVRAGLRVLALTGSQGKTSTKDLLAQVLEPNGATVAPHGNLNNEIGLPLTVARITAETRFLVAEMGARGIGHIAYLCEIVPPHVGLVLNVGQAHVGEFGDRSAIARAKGELVEALPSDGLAVLNADDSLVWAMAARTEAPVIGFGAETRPEAERAVWAADIRSGPLGRHRFRLHSTVDGQGEVAVEVALLGSGRHQVGNAVAAAAAAQAVGLDLVAIAAALGAAVPRSRWRMEVHERADRVVVINDAYNANPESMRSAVDTLAAVGAEDQRGTTWAVLGDMLELGVVAPAEHRSLGRHLAECGIDRLVAMGAYATELAAGTREAGVRTPPATVVVPDRAAAVREVLAGLRPGDVVLVKASRGLALDTVADQIHRAVPGSGGSPRPPDPNPPAPKDRS